MPVQAESVLLTDGGHRECQCERSGLANAWTECHFQFRPPRKTAMLLEDLKYLFIGNLQLRW